MKNSPPTAVNEQQYLQLHTGRVFIGSLRTGHIIGGILFLLASTLAVTVGFHACVMHALLYIFAFDGKMSGRMDGNVLMRNGRGRKFTVPALVRNSHTITARALLATYSAGFRSLTATQIAAWDAFTMTTSNRMGSTVTIKGKACYVRLNANLTLVSGTPITTPPALTGVASPTTSATLTVDHAASQPVSLAFAPTPSTTGTDHLIFATAKLGAGISKPSASAYRLIAVMPAGTATPYATALTTAYNTRFGAVVLADVGKKIFMSLTAVNTTTGQSIPSVGVSTVII